MTEREVIKKAIKHFECMKNDAVVVLDSGFGTHKGESDLVYRNRKMYAELAIEALEKQIPKKPIWNTSDFINRHHCPICDAIVDVAQQHCRCCGQRLDWGNEDAE